VGVAGRPVLVADVTASSGDATDERIVLEAERAADVGVGARAARAGDGGRAFVAGEGRCCCPPSRMAGDGAAALGVTGLAATTTGCSLASRGGEFSARVGSISAPDRSLVALCCLERCAGGKKKFRSKMEAAFYAHHAIRRGR